MAEALAARENGGDPKILNSGVLLGASEFRGDPFSAGREAASWAWARRLRRELRVGCWRQRRRRPAGSRGQKERVRRRCRRWPRLPRPFSAWLLLQRREPE